MHYGYENLNINYEIKRYAYELIMAYAKLDEDTSIVCDLMGIKISLIGTKETEDFDKNIVIHYNDECVFDYDNKIYLHGLWEIKLVEMYNKYSLLKENEKREKRTNEAYTYLYENIIKKAFSNSDTILNGRLRYVKEDSLNYKIYYNNVVVMHICETGENTYSFPIYTYGKWEQELEEYLDYLDNMNNYKKRA